MWVRNATVAGRNYVLQFTVTNPAIRKQGVGLFVEASGVPIARGRIDSQADTYLFCDTGGLSRQSDTTPLNTYAASFVDKRIGQTDQTPGAVNTISVTLSVSVPITKRMGIVITIAGLTGATAVTGDMPLVDIEDDWAAGHTNMFASKENGPRSKALWSNTHKTLKLWVQENMVPGEPTRTISARVSSLFFM